MRRCVTFACVLFALVAIGPTGAAAKGGHTILLGAPPAQVAPGATWDARVRVTDARGAPAWGAPAVLVLVDRASNATQRFSGGLTDRRGLASVRVRYARRGTWTITGVDGPVRATVVGAPGGSDLPAWSVAVLALVGLAGVSLLLRSRLR